MQMNDEHGCTLCNRLGEERHESYVSGFGRRKKRMVAYDYRHTNGNLFACVAPTLEECRRKRDEWIAKQA